MTREQETAKEDAATIPLRTLSGARAVREIYGWPQVVGEHSHDWPSLTVPLLGSFTGLYEDGEAWLCGPSALLHPAGNAHAAVIGEAGLENVNIHFDPVWLRCWGGAPTLERSRCWLGGSAAAAAHRLARAWMTPALPEPRLAEAVATFFTVAGAAAADRPPPAWVERARRALDAEPPPRTSELAARFGLNPAWLAEAYRGAAGEGVRDTVRRRRVALATTLLRRTRLPLAEIALVCGFCDQSHMNRSFRASIGRTPLEHSGRRSPRAQPGAEAA